jgi:hypothetical protein
MKRYHAGLFLLALLPALPAFADDTLVQARDAAAAKAPDGVTFQLTLSARQYHMGELISMTYAFSSTQADAWKLDMGTYDRSGRLSEEMFHIDPSAGAADPIADYFAMFQGFMGGGIRSMPPTLNEKPVELKFDLNEWLRIDKPGKYRLYIESARLSPAKPATPPATAPGNATATMIGSQLVVMQSPPAVSNIVEFEVLPFDAAWSNAQFEEIKKALTAKPDDGPAARRLRFLNTPESVLEMVRRLGTNDSLGWDLQAGLIGAPDRPGALATLQKRLVAPDQPVTPRFLSTLQMLDVMLAEKNLTRPGWGGTPAETQQYEQWWKDHQARMTAALTKAVEQLTASLPQKEPAAKAACLLTLQQSPAKEVAKPSADQAQALAASFDKLSPGDQRRLLENDWPRTRTTEILPQLLKMLDAPPTMTNDGLQLRDWAMTRAYELDPKTVRPLILAEMKSPPSLTTLPASYHMHALLALPDATLPEMDAVFADQLVNRGRDLRDLEMIARLISRYATAAIEPQVKAFFEPHAGSWACDPQASFLAYFLRVDDAYGKEAFAKCLAARQPNNSRCWGTLFADVARQVWTPNLEKLAIAALADRDVDAAVSAAQVLKSKGSPAAKDELLAALAAPYTPNPPRDQISPKDAVATRRWNLVTALLDGHRWVLTADELQKVEKLAIDDNAVAACRNQAKAASFQIDLRISPYIYLAGESYTTLEELQAKLLLYPAATRFTLLGSETDPTSKQLLEWASTHERQITRAQP